MSSDMLRSAYVHFLKSIHERCRECDFKSPVQSECKPNADLCFDLFCLEKYKVAQHSSWTCPKALKLIPNKLDLMIRMITALSKSETYIRCHEALARGRACTRFKPVFKKPFGLS